jgi:uncharacterized protein (DUF433 family)
MAEDAGQDELLAAPIETAARLAGVSVRRVRYWDQTGLVSPRIKQPATARTTVRLYEFDDLVELVVVATLLRERISLRHVRKLVAHLRRVGYQAPLRELRYAVVGDEVFVMHADGTWEGDRQPGQIVLQHVLPLEAIRMHVRKAAERPAELAGRIVQRRRVAGSKPVFAGTRVPVDVVVDYLAAGSTVDQIIEAFPLLTPADVAAARRQAGAA